MKQRLFVDTGFWIALFDSSDTYHVDAKNLFSSIFNSYDITSSELVVGETATYLNCP